MKLYIGESLKGLKLAREAEYYRSWSRKEWSSKCVGAFIAKRARKLMRQEGKFVGMSIWDEFKQS